MKKDNYVNLLYSLEKEKGLVFTINAFFGKRVSVTLPLGRSSLDEPLEAIDFSKRAINSLKRSGIFTVREVVDCISKNELLKIRNLGEKTLCEIQTRILVYGYDLLSEREKKQFFLDMLEKNEPIL